MFGVVQNNLYQERGYDALTAAWARRGIPHVLVRIAPILHRLLPTDFDSYSYSGDLADIVEAVVDDSGLVMTCGSVELSEVAASRGWIPGTFLNENFDWRVWSQHYGASALNAGGSGCRFDEVTFKGAAFVRPMLDDKAFAGRVLAACPCVRSRHRVRRRRDRSWQALRDGARLHQRRRFLCRRRGPPGGSA